MYTKEVENLKIRQILSLVEHTIENNLALYIFSIIMLSVISFSSSYYSNDSELVYIFMLFYSAILNLVLKISLLKKIKVDKLDNKLIIARAKKGNVGMQTLMFFVFYLVLIVFLAVVLGVGSVLFAAITLPNPEVAQIVIFLLALVGIPALFVFSMFVEGIIIEIFCKNEVNKFLSQAYLNIFKSKTKTLSKFLIGILLMTLGSLLISIPSLMPQTNTIGTILMDILSNCLVIVTWTYIYVVYMTSITEKDLQTIANNVNSENDENSINQENNQSNNELGNNLNNTENNTSSSEEITRLW